jgi:hypothetical protein
VSVVTARLDRKSIYIPLSLQLQGNSKIISDEALGDTGATGNFIDNDYVQNKQITRIPMTQPIDVYNVDGTKNKKGTITHYAKLLTTIGGKQTWETYYITGLGKQKKILGLPWF